MVYQAVYDKIRRWILPNVAAGIHIAIWNSMQHQTWNICDVTSRICINLLQCKGLPWRSIIKEELSSLRQLFANERPLKMMKNAFYFTLIWFSSYLNLRLKFSVLSRNGLIRKIWLISKLMTPQPDYTY